MMRNFAQIFIIIVCVYLLFGDFIEISIILIQKKIAMQMIDIDVINRLINV